MADREVKKPLSPFEKFVHAIANVPKTELREVQEREKRENGGPRKDFERQADH